MKAANLHPLLVHQHILIVEDEAAVGILLEELLEDAGARVTLAHTVDGALAALARASFDGVLLDVNLHGRTTGCVAEELAHRCIPFIVVSGYECKDNDTPALRAAPWLLKPFSRTAVLRCMADIFLGAAVGS